MKVSPEAGYISRAMVMHLHPLISESRLRRYEKESLYVPELNCQTPLLKRKQFDKDKNIYYEESQIKELAKILELVKPTLPQIRLKRKH